MQIGFDVDWLDQIVEEGAPADLLRKPDSYFSRMTAIE
jgi:hypothetical protein